MTRSFFTIGHSTRPISAFIELLEDSVIARVVDVRTVPRSRTNPQYNRDALPASLQEFGIDYVHIEALGGLRGRSLDTAPGLNAYWQNKSFHNYADYALSDEFKLGIRKLLELGDEKTCAVMCAETLWWRCHRRIIADYLIAAGELVFHILGPGQVRPARMTDGATAGPNDTLIYPAEPVLLRHSVRAPYGDPRAVTTKTCSTPDSAGINIGILPHGRLLEASRSEQFHTVCTFGHN